MTTTTKGIKKLSRNVFSENTVATLLATCICFFVYFIIYIASGIFAFSDLQIVAVVLALVGNILGLGPIILGLIRFLNRVLIDKKDNPISVFYYFTNKKLYKKSLSFIMTFLCKALFRGFSLYLPAIFVNLLTTDVFYSFFNLNIPFWTSNLQSIIGGLTIVATVLFILYLIRLYLAPALFVIDDNIDVDECFLMSKIVSKKSSVDYIFMVFSFFGWILLSVLWVPMLYTVPYFLYAYLTHARQTFFEYNSYLESLQKDDIHQYYEGV